MSDLLALTAPLFALIALGYLLGSRFGWDGPPAEALSRFTFGVAIPALLFRMMSGLPGLGALDLRLLLAYFGGVMVIFVIGFAIARFAFRHDGAAASVLATGCVFANSVLLGIPLTRTTLGERAMPSVSMVILFNALVLWTLVTVCVEWSRNRRSAMPGFLKTVRGVVINPIVGAILLGAGWGFAGGSLPVVLDRALTLLGEAAVPLSLVALGLGLAEYGIREGWRESIALTAIKLALMPLLVWLFARAIGVGTVEAQAITVLASMPVGANVYLMARAFGTAGPPVASSIVLSTLMSAVTTPAVIALTGGVSR